jgi:GntR family transcriptional regulator
LPSVRQLAGQLRINPATVVQAYRELEGDGFVEIRQGAGTFVRELPEKRRDEERSQQALGLARRTLAEAGRLRIPPRDLQQAIARILQGEGA